MTRPTTCPICGEKIVRVTNAVTKNSYFKCSNKDCHFVLGGNFTDEEFNLQGKTLETTCISCGKNLTVSNGPHGLYARCFNCNCDMKPTTFNGKVYQKWVNAHRNKAKEEIKALINSFNSRNSEEDQYFDFEKFIAKVTPEKKEAKKGAPKQANSMMNQIYNYLEARPNKGIGAEELSSALNFKANSVRTILLSMRTLELVKVVDYMANPMGNHTLYYQTTKSKLPELKTYTREGGYNTINAFLKENTKKYGELVRKREILTLALQKNGIKPILFHSSRGICDGYPIDILEKLMTNQPVQTKLNLQTSEKKPMSKKEELKKVLADHEEVRKEIIKIMQKDLNKPYTTAQIAKEIKSDLTYTRYIMRSLKKTKKIKIVGWDSSKDRMGAKALKYQLNESPLPRLKTTVDNNLYATLKQFYKKKLSGRRCTSLAKAKKAVSKLPTIPLIINQRAYVGYSVADLKETFKDYMGVAELPKRRKTSIPVEVEAAAMMSNPVAQKKSFISRFTSLFKRKSDKVPF